jgi:hypothetical protein
MLDGVAGESPATFFLPVSVVVLAGFPKKRHPAPMQLIVTVSHDDEVDIWFVESSDVPGLNAEAPTLDSLVEIISDLAPDLIAANMPNTIRDGTTVPLCVQHVVNARREHAL